MSFEWNTEKVATDLRAITPKIQSVVATPPGGDFDTTNLVISVKGTKDKLYVCGFESTVETIKNTDFCLVKWVELTDGNDSSGGLNSRSAELAGVYIKVRQYFINAGAEIIDHYSEIF